MDSAKLKLSTLILPEGDIPWHHEVDVVLIPLLHLYDMPCAKVRIAHWALLPLRLHTLRAYGFAAVRRNVANALVNLVLCCWSMRYSLAVASKRLFEKSFIGGISAVHYGHDCNTIPYRPH